LAGGHASRILECKQCGAVRVAGESCFHCGYLPAPPPRAIEFEDGELGLVDRARRTKPVVYDAAARERWHAMIIWIAKERDYKPGWVSHKYKEKFGSWPPWGASPGPMPPTAECRAWVRSRLIAYSKGRGAA
jgi:hypothetical protein